MISFGGFNVAETQYTSCSYDLVHQLECLLCKWIDDSPNFSISFTGSDTLLAGTTLKFSLKIELTVNYEMGTISVWFW